MKFNKPARLLPGDTVAVISPSWGGPSVFPHIYENGLKVLRNFGLQIKEFPTARTPADFLANHPEVRAKDINQLGMVTFHGPSIMAGFSQAESLPESFTQHVQRMLFSPQEELEYRRFELYCDGYLDWSKEENLGKTKELKQDAGWRFIQGSGVPSGELYGGCLEVLESLNGTDFWAGKDFWNGKVLFFETSEEKPSIQRVCRMLRNYGMQGIFAKAVAVLFGRARDYTDEEKIDCSNKSFNLVESPLT